MRTERSSFVGTTYFWCTGCFQQVVLNGAGFDGIDQITDQHGIAQRLILEGREERLLVGSLELNEREREIDRERDGALLTLSLAQVMISLSAIGVVALASFCRMESV